MELNARVYKDESYAVKCMKELGDYVSECGNLRIGNVIMYFFGILIYKGS